MEKTTNQFHKELRVSLYEQINEALESIYLTEDEHYGLVTAVKYFLENCDEIDRKYFYNRYLCLTDTVDKLRDIVSPKED